MINEDKMGGHLLSFLLLAFVVAILGALFQRHLKQKLKDVGGRDSHCAIVAMQGYDKALTCYQEEIGVSW
tara:strand:+ start:7331 stop:7540 length:210 start_codon:yes stop_codon:yes gene_type:complete